MKKLILLVSGLSFVLGVVTASQAQVTLDVSKVSCEQFVGYKIANPRDIAIWLSGYFNGQRGNIMLDTQELGANAKKLQDYCIRNREVPVMQAVETMQKK
jgi:hypothetical protein